MLDWLLPEFDASLAEHRVIDADPASVYRAVATVDMVEIPQAYPAVRALFAARGAAERLANALLGRPAPTVQSERADAARRHARARRVGQALQRPAVGAHLRRGRALLGR